MSWSAGLAGTGWSAARSATAARGRARAATPSQGCVSVDTAGGDTGQGVDMIDKGDMIYMVGMVDTVDVVDMVDIMLLQATIIRNYFVKTQTYVASFGPPDLSIIF